MNKKIGMVSSVVNMLAVVGFGVAMIVGSDFSSYLTSMFIAFSFVPMVSAFTVYTSMEKKAAGYSALVFAAAYAVLIWVVYFAQVTSVRLDPLNEQAAHILDYQQFGLFFSYDLLGYGLMALSTFFIGLTLEPVTIAERWLKGLLLVHGVFFISGLALPMLGLFNREMQGADWIGTAVLVFWCAYFTPVGALSYIFFKRRDALKSAEV